MEFGKVDPSQLDTIDHSLPSDAERTSRILKQNKTKSKTKVHFGCAKWGRKEWINLIYPKGTKEKDFLSHYGKHFDSLELNASFYRIFPDATIAGWANMVGDDFLFCPKFYQGITHLKRLKVEESKEWTDAFLRSISNFGDKLGPCFLQLPENFLPKNHEVLESYLKSLPKELEVFVELRHPNWYIGDERKRLFDMLEENNRGLLITDTSGRRDMIHMELTVPKAFIRFVGNNIHPTDYPRIDGWIERMGQWMKAGIDEIFFMMHQHDESNTPIISEYMIKKMNAELGLQLTVPKLLGQQTVLL